MIYGCDIKRLPKSQSLNYCSLTIFATLLTLLRTSDEKLCIYGRLAVEGNDFQYTLIKSLCFISSLLIVVKEQEQSFQIQTKKYNIPYFVNIFINQNCLSRYSSFNDIVKKYMFQKNNKIGLNLDLLMVAGKKWQLNEMRNAAY